MVLDFNDPKNTPSKPVGTIEVNGFDYTVRFRDLDPAVKARLQALEHLEEAVFHWNRLDKVEYADDKPHHMEAMSRAFADYKKTRGD